MNNKELGTSFERIVCDWLSDMGAWVHFLSPDRRGAQPFDIIAVRNNKVYAIECKTLNANSRWFPYSRLEENQKMACEKWIRCGNDIPLIFVQWRNGIYAINYQLLKDAKKVDMYEQTQIK